MMALAMLASGAGAAAACTPEDATARRAEISVRFQALLLDDPARATTLLPRLRALADTDRAAAGSLDWNQVCAEYDRVKALLR